MGDDPPILVWTSVFPWKVLELCGTPPWETNSPSDWCLFLLPIWDSLGNSLFLGIYYFHSQIERYMGLFRMSSEFVSNYLVASASFWPKVTEPFLASSVPLPAFYSFLPVMHEFLHRNILLESQTHCWVGVVSLLSWLLIFLFYQLLREMIANAFISVWISVLHSTFINPISTPYIP